MALDEPSGSTPRAWRAGLRRMRDRFSAPAPLINYGSNRDHQQGEHKNDDYR